MAWTVLYAGKTQIKTCIRKMDKGGLESPYSSDFSIEKCLTIRPSMMTKLSLMTLARGARQLVVQEALLEGGGRNGSLSFLYKCIVFTKHI